ncbi:MAG TPA: copper resistance protein CopC [Gaiellaceae bacterium]|nr:copper resistance protein CopC [Gaiellaceae bacterium]
MRARLGIVALMAAGALVAPAAASAHAYIVRASPGESQILESSPGQVALTYDEAVEPRFARISVTDEHGRELTTGRVARSPANPDTLVVPLRPKLPSGWYLVYWRAISVDGHPVQGGYEFAVGPTPGKPPEFTQPRTTGSATSPDAIVTRWLAFLSVMTAIGLFVLRIAIARPLVRRVEGTTLRPLTVAFAVAAGIALLAVPVYLDVATAIDSLESAFSVGSLVPLFRVTAFGRAWVDVELCFALFCAAAAVALWLDRPDRPRRSVAELIAGLGAVLAAAAVLLIPGLAGHAAQTAPRGLSLLFDWSHLVAGSLWLGGLGGLLVLAAALPAGRRVAGLGVCIPRFSNVAFVSVLVLLGSGVGASILHLPLLAALWQTSYGVAILVKAGLLGAALVLGAVNLLWTRPRLAAAGESAGPAARLLRRTIGLEVALVTGAVLAAAILSSLPPPPAAFAAASSKLATVGPGPVSSVVRAGGYSLALRISPNRVGVANSFAVGLSRNGTPVTGADVTLVFNMLEMQMGQLEYQLVETSPGVYTRRAPALVMAGRWSLAFTVTPKRGTPFSALVVDHTTG